MPPSDALIPMLMSGQSLSADAFSSALLWVARPGARWRSPPREYGYGKAVYRRFARRAGQGVFEQLLDTFAGDADVDYLIIDSAITRGRGAPKVTAKRTGTKKVAAAFPIKCTSPLDALGNLLRLILTAGWRLDSPQAAALIEVGEARTLIADKDYASDGLTEAVTAKDIVAVIPPEERRLVQREYDRHLYRERHSAECFIKRIKHRRRVFSPSRGCRRAI